ncbi:hypothetical protein F4861DRAFT_527192 [Xylaria intraflava]|nr:hypothetical protein F4861DRAFT_527192 [Xylaria intraflava]
MFLWIRGLTFSTSPAMSDTAALTHLPSTPVSPFRARAYNLGSPRSPYGRLHHTGKYRKFQANNRSSKSTCLEHV